MNHNVRTIQIRDRLIGPGHPCYIIAEVGINHNGQLELAKQLADAARRAGADAVKFQKRNLKNVYRRQILETPQQAEQGLQYLLPILTEFELSDEEFWQLRDYCQKIGIEFLCTAFDEESLSCLEMMGVPAHKVASPDMTNFLFLERVLQTHKPFLLSTGMSTEEEIRRTIHFLNERNANYALFHCLSCYPAPPDEINLRFMQTLQNWSGRPVGYSGHETGIWVSIAAVGMGAQLLERHITMDRTMRGPDHAASLEPHEFAELVRAVREVESALGVEHRWLTRGEMLNRRNLAKSLVARTDLPAGTRITRDMVAAKSPGLGLSPQGLNELVGKVLTRAMRCDEPFTEKDVGAEEAGEKWSPESVDIGMPWGIIVRFSDMANIIEKFGTLGMSTLEFHLSDRDLDAGMRNFPIGEYPFELCVHAPEYCFDHLIDLCSDDEAQYELSIQRIQQTIDLTRGLAKYFVKTSSRGPKLVFHVGGMARSSGPYDLNAAVERLLRAIRRLDYDGVDLLLENLPPYPWYFGGRWYGYVLTDAQTTVQVCEESGLGLCFDTSHAMLQCNREKSSMAEFTKAVAPYVRHIHFSDGAGVSGEGLQIGEGQINFIEIMPILVGSGADGVPEIWMGHHRQGYGFYVALRRLHEIVWAVRAMQKAVSPEKRSNLQDMIVPLDAQVIDALRCVDRNGMGVVFVVGPDGTLKGLATDGDIRRGLMRGAGLSSPIQDVMNTNFVFAYETTPRGDVRKELSSQFRVVPIVNAMRELTDFVSIWDGVGNP